MHNLEIEGNVREKWTTLTDDNIRLIIGEEEESIGCLQQRITEAREAVEDAHCHITQLLTGKINWLTQRSQEPAFPEDWCALDTSHPIVRFKR